MTEHPFRYDQQLLEECVSSDLARFILVEKTKTTTSATRKNQQNNQQQQQQHQQQQQSMMDLTKFFTKRTTTTTTTTNNDDPKSCFELFSQHARHYKRPPPLSFDNLKVMTTVGTTTAAATTTRNVQQQQQQDRFVNFVRNCILVYNHNNNNNNNNNNSTTTSTTTTPAASPASSFSYSIALNRFADMDLDTVLLSPVLDNNNDDAAANGNDDGDDKKKTVSSMGGHNIWWYPNGMITPLTTTTTTITSHHHHYHHHHHDEAIEGHDNDGDDKMSVDGWWQHRQQRQWGIGHGSFNKLNPKVYNNNNNKKKKKKDNIYNDLLDDTYIEIPMDEQHDQFETPHVEDTPENDGSLLSVKRNHGYHHRRRRRHQFDKRRNSSVNVVDNANNVPAGDDPDNDLDDDDDDDNNGEVHDPFSTYLNWATNDNPDGVPIVHEPFDQGMCGACWAFAAAGSVEASAARREAYNVYASFMRDKLDAYRNETAAPKDSWNNNNSNNNNNNFKTEAEFQQAAVEAAQIQEVQSFQMLNLSVQELVDCDTAADQGCTGGNPLLAFFYIHRYGLTTWSNYPYVGYEDQCRKFAVRQPVASVKSWGVISPNHENHIELALRFIGPVAVGVNGGEHTFLSYSGGIYDNENCRQGANHALLIVGYGQEEADDGQLKRFWIVRNSWGKGWGENGFARIARREGSKGVPGVCGIARSPSVALGGFLLDREALHSETMESGVPVLEYSPIERICIFVGAKLDGSCGRLSDWVDTHHAYVVAFLGLFLALLSIWPLSSDWRKRRRRRREREARRRRSALRQADTAKDTETGETSPLLSTGNPHEDAEKGESSPLLPVDGANNSYGTDGIQRKLHAVSDIHQ